MSTRSCLEATLYEVLPVLSFLDHILCVYVEWNHFQRLLTLLTWANVSTVTNQDSRVLKLDAGSAFQQSLRCLNILSLETLDACKLLIGQYEWTDSSVRTNE